MKESPWSQAADSYTEEVVGETITSVDQLWRQTERRRPSGGDAVKKKKGWLMEERRVQLRLELLIRLLDFPALIRNISEKASAPRLTVPENEFGVWEFKFFIATTMAGIVKTWLPGNCCSASQSGRGVGFGIQIQTSSHSFFFFSFFLFSVSFIV